MNTLIESILELEWAMFTHVENAGGRASCQDDEETFRIMRGSQFQTWGEAVLQSYLQDLRTAKAHGRNLVTEKYAFMMAFTHPDEFEAIQHLLPGISPESKQSIQVIVALYAEWTQAVDKAFPFFAMRGRPRMQNSALSSVPSVNVYLYGELETYSSATLKVYKQYVSACQLEGRNLVQEMYTHTARAYGYPSLEKAEESLRQKATANTVFA